MEILACLFIAIGCFEYTTEDCARDVFYLWSDIPAGQRPAYCDGAQCLPFDWESEHLVRREMECTC
jgi:hypothetical protein